jgi:hypothetical protein
MPIALLGVGVFLVFYLGSHGEISILNVSQMLVVFMSLWCASVFLIKKEYLQTLTGLLKKGYFTGSALFLNDEGVTNILLKKTREGTALEIIHALNLLEKSGYSDRHKLLLTFLQHNDEQVRTYVLLRVIANNMTSALPLIKQQLEVAPQQRLAPQLYKAMFFLQQGSLETFDEVLADLSPLNKKAALVGLLLRKQEGAEETVCKEVEKLSKSTSLTDRLLALEIIQDSGSGMFGVQLSELLNDEKEQVCKKAIETIGGVKNLQLLEPMIETVKKRGLYTAFKAALGYYGDEAFVEGYYKPEVLNEPLLLAVIKSAGKITGETSTSLLLHFLATSSKFPDQIIQALWLKKAVLPEKNKSLVEHCIAQKLETTSMKLSYHAILASDNKFSQLQDAIQKEVTVDLNTLLRLYTFVFDPQKLNRIIELIAMGSTSRIFNAIEMLELTLPAKYFSPTNQLIEWLQDVQGSHLVKTKTARSPVKVLEEIFLENKAELHAWTRSVACYALLQIQKDEHLMHSLQRSKFTRDDRLFAETRSYVLSSLNN